MFPESGSEGEKASSSGSRQGVVLLGDSCHCFPPDIGQGVNSALQDVCVLDHTLERFVCFVFVASSCGGLFLSPRHVVIVVV
jgi:hypothetical protein